MMILVKKVTNNQKKRGQDHGQNLQIVRKMIPLGVERKRSVQACPPLHQCSNYPKIQKENAVTMTVF